MRVHIDSDILYKIDKSKLWQRTKNKISFTKKILSA